MTTVFNTTEQLLTRGSTEYFTYENISSALRHPLCLCSSERLWPSLQTHYTQNTLAPSQVCHWSAFGSVCGLKPRIMLMTCWRDRSAANHVCANSFSSGVHLSLCHNLKGEKKTHPQILFHCYILEILLVHSSGNDEILCFSLCTLPRSCPVCLSSSYDLDFPE